jgi:hypothetical protein
MNDVLNKTINQLLFMYTGAMFDCFMTLYGLYLTNGKEANPLFNWMNPPYMIVISAASLFVLSMVIILILLSILNYLSKKYDKNITSRISTINKFLIFGGIWHFLCGSTWIMW